MTAPRTFVGFGFGPIQGGLFALEAYRSGRFDRIVVAEVMPELVSAVRSAGGGYAVNVAGKAGVQACVIEGVEILNPLDAADAERLVSAVADASELATALPSVEFFDRGTPSVASILAQGFSSKIRDAGRPAAVVYAGENHNHAAELLERAVLAHLSRAPLGDRVQFLNTVIGKMSGVVSDAAEIERSRLAPLVPGWPRAFLLEEFNRILISQVRLSGFRRGIAVFVEKPDLLPFEEAKLYGHNAVHALIGYLANRKGYTFMSEVAADAGLVALAREAFLIESGQALLARHAGIDALFTPGGYKEYAEDLLDRMMNPWLRDRVARVIRDPRRKLGWDDRLIGTMRLALGAGIAPARFAAGAAEALRLIESETGASAGSLLDALWQEPDDPPGRKAEIRRLVLEARAADRG